MTGAKTNLKRGLAWIGLLSAITGAHTAWARPGTETATRARALYGHIELTPMLIDYELPGHPSIRGRGHAGTILRGTLVWRHDRFFAVEAGVVGRVPFAHDLGVEAGVLPVLALTLEPFGPGALLRFGSLDDRHGFHPALVDEARYAYGRNYEENYNQSIVPEARRDLGGDPFMPAEHGAQLIVRTGIIRAEAFLDWQLLETESHREKFAFGLLAGVAHRVVDLNFQLRITHYGGELFTRGDPLRAGQLDPVRQPTALALTGVLRPFELEGFFRLELPAAFARGRMAQAPGAAAEWRQGLEVGGDLVFLDAARAGYRLWWPLGNDSGFLSEDGDPVYAGRRSHRARVALETRHGAVSMSARLDLVFAAETEKIQYETVTALAFSFDPLIWSMTP